MNKAITIILVILCSLLLWIDLVYKEKVEHVETEWEKCEDNVQIIRDFKCGRDY